MSEMYRAEREKLVEEMTKVEGYDESAFIAMDSKANTVELLGDRQLPEQTRRAVDTVGRKFLIRLWRSRSERLAIGSRTGGKNSVPPYITNTNKRRVVHGQTATTSIK